jgi:hypothetical protein
MNRFHDSKRGARDAARSVQAAPTEWLTMPLASTYRQEVPIRTLSVSLLAVAAVAASLLIARQRDERPVQLPVHTGGEDLPAEHSLDAIRAAGL